MMLTPEYLDHTLIFAPQGLIDGASAGALEAALVAALAVDADPAVARLVLDLGAVEYMSSAGLRVVVVVSRRMKQRQGSLVLCNLQPLVREVFEVSGLLGMIRVVPDRAAALQA